MSRVFVYILGIRTNCLVLNFTYMVVTRNVSWYYLQIRSYRQHSRALLNALNKLNILSLSEASKKLRMLKTGKRPH